MWEASLRAATRISKDDGRPPEAASHMREPGAHLNTSSKTQSKFDPVIRRVFSVSQDNHLNARRVVSPAGSFPPYLSVFEQHGSRCRFVAPFSHVYHRAVIRVDVRDPIRALP